MSKRDEFAPLLKPPKRDPLGRTLRRLAHLVRAEHRHDLGPAERSWERFVERGARGAALGAAFAGLLLLVGLVRCAFITVGGGHVEPLTARDSLGLAMYVLGFAAAGALTGVLYPLRLVPGGPVVLGILAFAMVFGAIQWWMSGAPTTWNTGDWLTWVVLAILFGVFAGRRFFEPDPWASNSRREPHN